MAVNQHSVVPRHLSMPTGIVEKIKKLLSAKIAKLLAGFLVVGLCIYSWQQIMLARGVQFPAAFSVVLGIAILVFGYVLLNPESVQKEPPQRR